MNLWIPILFSLFWIYLTYRCVFSVNNFHPFGKPWIGRGLWAYGFLTLSPFIVLIYFLLGWKFSILKLSNRKRSWTILILVVGELSLGFGAQLLHSSLPNHYQKNYKNKFETERGLDRYLPSYAFGLDFSHHSIHEGVITKTDNYPARLHCSEVIILTSTDHPLLQQASETIIIGLEEFKFIKKISFYPKGKLLDQHSTAPGLVIAIEECNLISLSLPLVSVVNTSFLLTTSWSPRVLASDFERCQGSGKCNLVANWDSDQNVNTFGVSIGLESISKRKNLLGKSIGKLILEKITPTLKEISKERGTVESLPEVLYPEHKDPLIPNYILERPSITHRLSFSTPLNHNYNVWTFRDKRERKVVFEEMIKEMEKDGWKLLGYFNDHDQEILFQSRHNFYRFKAQGIKVGPNFINLSFNGDPSTPKDELHVYSLTLAQPVSEDERSAILNELSSGNYSAIELSSLSNLLSSYDKDKYIQALVNARPQRIESQLELARIHGELHQRELALKSMENAHFLEQVCGIKHYREPIEKVMGRFGFKITEDPDRQLEILKSLNFLMIPKENVTYSVQVNSNDHFHLGYYWNYESGIKDVRTLCCVIRRETGVGKEKYRIYTRQSGMNGGSRFSLNGKPGNLDKNGKWTAWAGESMNFGTFNVKFEEIDDDRFNVNVTTRIRESNN